MNEILIKCEEKIFAENSRLGNKIPYDISNQMYEVDWKEKDLAWWTNGFWGGIQWLLYQVNGKEQYLNTANTLENTFDELFLSKFDSLNHDVGFMWSHTALANYRITGNKASKVRALHAASILASRYNANGNYLVAWNGKPEWMIVDSLMNIPILFWASNEIKDPRFKSIALKHADTALKYVMRADGSVKHIIEFDPDSGEYIKSHGGQGFAHNSAWSRGQAWALYGFALAYKYTNEQRYLDASKTIANYFIAQISNTNHISDIDFKSSENSQKIDTTASAIAASGLIELSQLLTNSKEKAIYFDSARHIVESLNELYCDYNVETDSILQYCSECYHPQDGFQEKHIIYGDYFYIEAVMKLCGYKLNMW